MIINNLKPAFGSRFTAKRVGRGIGSGLGKTGGRGHKGQKSRSGGKLRRGFEGGQMPLYRCLPKFGFISNKLKYKEEILTSDLFKIENKIINFNILKTKGIINNKTKFVKIILSTKVPKNINITQDKNLRISSGAIRVIEEFGGKVNNKLYFKE